MLVKPPTPKPFPKKWRDLEKLDMPEAYEIISWLLSFGMLSKLVETIGEIFLLFITFGTSTLSVEVLSTWILVSYWREVATGV
jgi:hypothetical protein